MLKATQDNLPADVAIFSAAVSDFKVKDGFVRIWCTNWDNKTENEQGFEDTLNIDLSTQIFLDWLNLKAYK